VAPWLSRKTEPFADFEVLTSLMVFKSSDQSLLVVINRPSRFGPIAINRPSRPTNRDFRN
jgi:hypothetical protein